ncbi:MAG TPA: APC family permease [Anaerovoracaceae bacterium]|nr:APC family permease [Anaerovoracaceae bacterium]
MNENNRISSNLERFGYEQTLNRVMDLKAVVFFGLAYISPGTIFTTYGIVTKMTHGMLALTYLVATSAMLFTALSYGHMSRAYPIAGSVYSYVTRSIHPYLGFLSGWAILMDYLLIPLLNFIAAGIFVNAFLPFIPIWAVVITIVTVVTIINCIGIKVASTANIIMVTITIIVVLAIVFFSLKWIVIGTGVASLIDIKGIFNAIEFNKPEVGITGILAGASILSLSFLGFDAITTVAEEAIEPEKNIGKAILITCFGAGGAFVVMAYIFQLAWPEAWFQFVNVEAGANELILRVAGSTMVSIFIGVVVVGASASAIASQASAARILFGMGRDGALPKKFFGYIHPKFKTPIYNILLISLIGLSGLMMNITIATSLINFGALAGFALVNISVIAHYFIRKKERNGTSIIKYLIFPIIGACICIMLWLNLAVFAKILGFSWLGLGIIWLMITSKFFRELPPELKMNE